MKPLIPPPGTTDDDGVRLTFPYWYGVLAAGTFRDLIAWGRVYGCEITDHRGGGVLVKRGQLVVRGRYGDVRRFRDLYARMEAS